MDRIQSSSLLEDRRDASRALKALSRKYRVEVGAQGMNALCQILQTDSADMEIISYALETLCNITSPHLFDEEGFIFSSLFIKVNFKILLISSVLLIREASWR